VKVAEDGRLISVRTWTSILLSKLPKERDANNFPIGLEYDIKSVDRSATRWSIPWTPMHRESNG
jgi:hypothetical protein